MDWLVGISLLLVGAVIGFFTAKHFFTQSEADNKQQNAEKTEKEIFSEQASIHVTESRNLLLRIQQQCNQMQSQIDSYEELIAQQKQAPQGEQVEYFGEQAALYLRNKKKEVKAEKVSTDYQPRDYSEGSSGLFTGAEDAPAEKTQS